MPEILCHSSAAFNYGMTTGFYQALFYATPQVVDSMTIFIFISRNARGSVLTRQLTHAHRLKRCVFDVF